MPPMDGRRLQPSDFFAWERWSFRLADRLSAWWASLKGSIETADKREDTDAMIDLSRELQRIQPRDGDQLVPPGLKPVGPVTISGVWDVEAALPGTRWCPSCAAERNVYRSGSGGSVPAGSVCCASCQRALVVADSNGG